MSERSAVPSTFIIERNYPANPAEVFDKWAKQSEKARWFQPAEVFDFRVGGQEIGRGGPPGGPVFTFTALYQEIVPGERLVYTYSLDASDVRWSVSVVTVEIAPSAGGSKLRYTEQGIFLDGHDLPAQREGGTAEMLDKLGASLMPASDAEERNSLVSRRVYEAPLHQVHSAWTDPAKLALWWGPNGFTNTFHTFDPRPGGVWQLTMHGPDGTDYPNQSRFLEIEPHRIVILHESGHRFVLTATFEDLGNRTALTFRQTFESDEEFEKVKAMCAEANEQNLDRLEAVL